MLQIVVFSSHLLALAKIKAGSSDDTLLDVSKECTLTGSRCWIKYRLVMNVPV